MVSRRPATVNFSFDVLARHGQTSGRNKDGWGIGYYDDGDVRLIREPNAAADSDWVRFIEEHQLCSRLVLAHIRHATEGTRTLRNTQPFARSLGGRMHLFAHNGDFPEIRSVPDLRLGFHHPIGETDSEYAFCALLGRLEHIWRTGVPSDIERLSSVTAFAATLRDLGPANFLYTDGDMLFVHGHRRRHDDGSVRSPGLYLLQRRCSDGPQAVRAAGVEITSEDQMVALVASVPLTDEPWHAMAEGAVVALRNGDV